MTVTLLNSYNDVDINLLEYQVEFTNEPIPGEQILLGLNYVTREIIAECRGEQIIIGTMPNINNGPIRLLLTIEMPGINDNYIPYEIYYNFSEETNEFTQELINPFIAYLPRPNLYVAHLGGIYDDVTFDYIIEVSIFSNIPTTITTYIEITDFNNILYHTATTLDLNYSNSVLLPVGEYIITVISTAFDNITATYTETFNVIGAIKYKFLELYNNINTIYPIYVSITPLPIITSVNISVLNSNTVEVNYQTLNANSVDIITAFGQDFTNISPNGAITFNNLLVNTLYEFTIIARDLNSNFDSRDLSFTIIVNIVNNTKGILGLKRGKEL